MTKRVLLQNNEPSIFHGDTFSFAVVGFAVQGGSIVPIELTFARSFSLAMQFYNDDAEQLALVAVYAVPEINDVPGSEKLVLIASNSRLPEAWHNPPAAVLFTGEPIDE